MARIPAVYLLVLTTLSVVLATPIKYNQDESSIPLTPTPGGFLHSKCVHEVPSGSVVSKDGDYIIVQHGSQEMVIPPCEYRPSSIRSKASLSKQDSQGKRDSGWIVWGSAQGTSYSSFNGGWKVPAVPSAANNQTVFFFTGLEDAEGDEIIQPVLQWGPSYAGGGEYWTVASWWVTSTGSALFSTLTRCNTGDYIFGTMKQTTSGSWTISTFINGKNPTVLSVQNVAPQAMASVTLEAYNILSCGNYPVTGSITFTNMTISDSGSPVQPSWSPNTVFTNCGEQVEVESPSEVTITF